MLAYSFGCLNRVAHVSYVLEHDCKLIPSQSRYEVSRSQTSFEPACGRYEELVLRYFPLRAF